MPALCRDCCKPFKSGADCPRCGSTRVVVHPELFELTIAHVDCDSFYASVEKRDNPAIRDKPVIVGHSGGRGVVTTACYLARKYGPRSAMPMFKALELCPQAVVVPPDIAKYARVSADIRALFVKATPLVEPVSLDEAYLDLSLGARLVDKPAALLLARLARAIERRVGITVSVGLSYNKFLAKMASDRDKPRGFSVTGRAEATTLLAGMPVSAIWGVGAATARRMADADLATIGDIQLRSEAELVARFGKFGRHLFLMARGEDPRKVEPDRPAKSVSNETTFTKDIADHARLAEMLEPLVVKVAARLARAELAGATIVLKLKGSDFRVLTRNHRLPDPTARAELIGRVAQAMLAKVLAEAAPEGRSAEAAPEGRSAEAAPEGRSFRLIGVGVTDLCSGRRADPPDLFPP